MNGCAHLGHAYSASKAEFIATYQRLLGKNVLFPFAFHTTGMPIKACADKLAQEMKEFGCPPVFPKPEGDGAATTTTTKADPSSRSRKPKLTRKVGKKVYQWEIMQEMGIPDMDIPAFADARHWQDYFPQCWQADLTRFGASIDWRRSFITTEVCRIYCVVSFILITVTGQSLLRLFCPLAIRCPQT